MKTEVYINKIIETTGLTRNEIKSMIEEKKKELKGLISEEGALFIIAKELSVDVKDENKEFLKDIEINISDITPNMKNITLIGRIKEIYRVHKFNKKDGGVGYVGSFLLHDNTGDIRIVLWDEHIKIFEDNNFKKNEVVKIINGTANKGKFYNIEVHIGKFSKIILSPEDIDYKKYPKIKDEVIPIQNISLSNSSISIEGKILRISPTNEFIRKDGEIGKVKSINLIDSSGSIRVTFWNDDIEKLNGFNEGDVISLTNLSPRISNLDSKTIELYTNFKTIVSKKNKSIKVKERLIEKIKFLQDSQNIVSFQGIISSIDNLKNVTLKSGEQVSLLSFTVSDDSDAIRVTLWREKAEEFSESLNVGSGILLKKVMVKYSNFSGRNEISFINESTIELIDLDIKNIKVIQSTKKEIKSFFTGNYTKINKVNSSGIFEIKGFIAKELNNITIYEACPNCFKKFENCLCTEKDEPEYRMIFNVIIDDGSATMRTTFIGEQAEKLIGEKTEMILKIRETPDFDGFLEKKSAELLGRDIVIRGKAKFNDFSNSYELVAFDFQDLNINEELEKTIKEISP